MSCRSIRKRRHVNADARALMKAMTDYVKAITPRYPEHFYAPTDGLRVVEHIIDEAKR